MTITLPQFSDICTIYGEDNVNRWGNLNNDGNRKDVIARVNWAINEAYIYVIGRISLRYDITQFVTLPAIVFSLITRRAGIELYQSPRGLVDGDRVTAQLNAQSTYIEARLDQILSGQLPLVDAPAASQDVNYPTVNNGAIRKFFNPWGGDCGYHRYDVDGPSGDPILIDCGAMRLGN